MALCATHLLIAKKPKTKLVVCAGAGYENIDLKACHSKEIVPVAELVFGMTLVNARNNFDGSSGFEISGRSIAFYRFVGAVSR